MRFAFLLITLVLLAPHARAQQDQPARKGHDRHQEPGFIVLASLISDSTFFEQWERPDPPEIRDDTRYARGEIVYPVLIFQTDAVDEEGNAALTYDLTVTKPDGSPYGGSPFSGLPAWGDAPTLGLSLALAQVSILIEDDDPVGIYGVEIMINDSVRGASVPLSLAFEVTE